MQPRAKHHGDPLTKQKNLGLLAKEMLNSDLR
jgi:hypothetical protein